MYTHEPEPGFFENNSILIKGFLVGFLILIMLIPGVFVSNLVNERQMRQEAVVNDVSRKWAGKQTITGPMLMLPYKTDAGTVRMAYVLPEDLHISGNIDPTKKKRSLYNVMLYTSKLKLDGRFNIPFEKLQLDKANILWGNARLVLAVGDMHGITEQVALTWNGTKQMMEAGVPENKQVTEGLSAPIVMNEDGTATFIIDLSLKGSEYLYFTPLGKSTDVNISAAWKDPKFDGQYLPDTSVISKDQFSAHWKILPMSHNYPQCWKDNVYSLNKAAFGVSLIQPVDEYSKTSRSVKYAILFIALTFTFFFFLEILLKKRIHAIQYLLVGMALTIFYTLLLSISEYAGFNMAYFIAAIATVTLISMYVWSIFKSTKTALGFTFTLLGLYGYIFILIQSEDYALLFGSIGLFVILAVIMYYSRKIEWYAPARIGAEVPHNDYKANINDEHNEQSDEERNERLK